jgi:hypothetical protein
MPVTVPASAVVGFGGIHEKEEDAITHLAFMYSEKHMLYSSRGINIVEDYQYSISNFNSL